MTDPTPEQRAAFILDEVCNSACEYMAQPMVGCLDVRADAGPLIARHIREAEDAALRVWPPTHSHPIPCPSHVATFCPAPDRQALEPPVVHCALCGGIGAVRVRLADLPAVQRVGDAWERVP